jgi:hypothetical protein
MGATGSSTGELIGRQVLPGATGTYVPTPGATKAIVRGCGGGGGGGGVPILAGGVSAAAAGGNSGVSVEREISTYPLPMTGGAYTIGPGGAGGLAATSGAAGGDSTLVIGGVTLTAPGGSGGSPGQGVAPPTIIPSSAQTPAGPGFDYQAYDLGGDGIAQQTTAFVVGGNGGSGDYGGGGLGGRSVGNGSDAVGNGAGGGGASTLQNSIAENGGDGAPGLWIIEEYT